eukprot:scaffold8715_cov87-Isochrysis_galbana.AAC.1
MRDGVLTSADVCVGLCVPVMVCTGGLFMVGAAAGGADAAIQGLGWGGPRGALPTALRNLEAQRVACILMSIETLLASGDSAGHPGLKKKRPFCFHSPSPLSPHPFSLFRPLLVGGWFKSCVLRALQQPEV